MVNRVTPMEDDTGSNGVKPSGYFEERRPVLV
jgi:hypothetical protein